MMKIIIYWVVLVYIQTNVAYADYRLPLNVGHGAYERGGKMLRQQLRNKQVSRPHKQLVNQRITDPVSVQGKRGVTIVSGVDAINNKRLLSTGGSDVAMVEVTCPKRGGKIIIRASRFTNNGEIISFGGGNASMVTQKCSSGLSMDVEIIGNNFSNNGSVRAE